MIGIVGPADSVSLARAVAEENGFANEIITRVYTHADEAYALALELDQTCQVLLFTGQVPYAEASTELHLQAELQFISHSGADLYRCMARVLIDRGGAMPRVSVDSIDELVVLGAFAGLGLQAPVAHPLPTPDEGSGHAVAEILDFHRSEAKQRHVDIAMTCLAEVHAALEDEGLPVWRIEHTKNTVSEALQKARLSDTLIRLRSEQLAIALFQIDASALRRLDVYEREVARLQVHRELIDLARKNGGRLSSLEDGTFSLATSRGTIETAIERQKARHASLLDPLFLDIPIHSGIGIGSTFSQAESNARQAVGLSRNNNDTHIVFPDGRVHSAEVGSKNGYLHLQDSMGSYAVLARRLGVGGLSARRLIEALRRLGPEAISAQQLADAYGVQVRSARRLLSSLVHEGFATEAGVWMRPGAGRPQARYKIDVKALMDIVSAPASGSSARETSIEKASPESGGGGA